MSVGVLIVGMVLLAVGAQGAIRLVAAGSGLSLELIAYIVVAIAGLVMAGWGADRARKRGQIT